MLPPTKRQLRPTVSQPSTAEHYGSQHGIPAEVQAALLNVGRRGRMAVSQGRQLDRTQSFPVVGSSSFLPQPSSSSFGYPPTAGFETSQETIARAQDVIAKDFMRRNELRPFGDVSGVFGSSPNEPKSSPPQRSLSFNTDGTAQVSGPNFFKTRPQKRRGIDGQDHGSDTECEEDDESTNQGAAFVTPSSSITEDFPPVFKSPQISQPELFAPPHPVPLGPSRRVRGLPGRNLGKTVSAPVGKLDFGGWGETGTQDGMDTEEDGFDVSEWATNEEF